MAEKSSPDAIDLLRDSIRDPFHSADGLVVRFRRYYSYCQTVEIDSVFFPVTQEAQDDLTFLLHELVRRLTPEQIQLFRDRSESYSPLLRLTLFSVLLRALRIHEDDCHRELELPSSRIYHQMIRSYDDALVRAVQEGHVFPPRASVDLERMFSSTTDRNLRIRLTLLDRLVDSTTDEQIERYLVVLHACLPRYRKEMRECVDEILGLYGDLIDTYFREVYRTKRAKIESAQNELSYRRLLGVLAAHDDAREVESYSGITQPREELKRLDAATARLYRLRDGLMGLMVRTYPTPHAVAILALPGSDEVVEAKARFWNSYANLKKAV